MSRKERRAGVKQARRFASQAEFDHQSPSAEADRAYVEAMRQYRRGEAAAAERLCRDILARDPGHLRTLVLLGDIVQRDGRNKLAVKLLGRALELDPGDAAAHDNIAMAYQALGRRADALQHYAEAIALGLAGVEMLVKQSRAVATPLQHLADAWPRQLRLDELLGDEGASALAEEALLLALLQSRAICEHELERLLTAIRRGLLQRVIEDGPTTVEHGTLELFCALAEQCFINEYVFALDNAERAQLQQIQDRVAGALKAGAAIAPIDLIALASYLPLHELPLASSLLGGTWPDAMARLLNKQVREPLEEAADRHAIPALTPVDALSLQVQNQYEENPYPRWITVPPVKPTTVADHLRETLGITPESWPKTSIEVLIPGCGTGSHSIQTARRYPYSQVLAVDVSRASLAYARRMTRALGLRNIEYGQADILQLGSIDRRFDLIEAVGVLHHLADPAEGWERLLSLLRPNGLMFIGLYSAMARRSVTAARAFIAERGYRATADDIRACRQELIARARVPPFNDFATVSGCRDLLFNVTEHQFTIPQIKAFLDANRLTFLGFDQLPGEVPEQFRRQFFDPAAMRDLGAWDRFEQMHPLAFGNMYFFWVQKSGSN
jgi:2-polyprenyl-3-methyl-5-hydroxy-6-metoxy-1,4-benzoquinol methylase